MKTFQSKYSSIPGSSYKELLPIVKREYKKIENLTKRQPYLRSEYFTKDKVFLSSFWTHLMQKNFKQRTLRLKLFNAAIDLMRNSRCESETIFKKDDRSVILHRFYGITKDGVKYCVQVKQEKRTGRKDFMSVYPIREFPEN